MPGNTIRAPTVICDNVVVVIAPRTGRVTKIFPTRLRADSTNVNGDVYLIFKLNRWPKADRNWKTMSIFISVLERKVLSRIYGPYKNSRTGVRRKTQ